MTTALPTTEPLSGRQRILEAAAALFVERGYAETSLRDLARTVDMKAGSLYYHFASKDELLVELFEQGIDLMLEGFACAAAEADARNASDEERLGLHVAAHLRMLHANHPLTTLHVTTFRNAPPAVRERIVVRRDAYESRWTKLLRKLVAGRTRREINILRLTLFGAMNASIEWFDTGRGNLDQFAQLVTDQFWSGVAPEAAPVDKHASRERVR